MHFWVKSYEVYAILALSVALSYVLISMCIGGVELKMKTIYKDWLKWIWIYNIICNW